MIDFKKELILTLAGIELDIEILICILLWINHYKVAFWILLVLFILGSIIKVERVKNG